MKLSEDEVLEYLMNQAAQALSRESESASAERFEHMLMVAYNGRFRDFSDVRRTPDGNPIVPVLLVTFGDRTAVYAGGRLVRVDDYGAFKPSVRKWALDAAYRVGVNRFDLDSDDGLAIEVTDMTQLPGYTPAREARLDDLLKNDFPAREGFIREFFTREEALKF